MTTSIIAQMTRLAFLGPAGTFTEEALRTQPDLAGMELVAVKNMNDILAMTERGEVDFGFAPIENAIEGTVNITLDGLVFDTNLLIQREVVLPIHLQLGAKAGTKWEDVTTIVSFPVAIAQVRSFIEDKFPNAHIESASSTAEAMKMVSERDDNTCAAVGPELAATMYGLEVIARDIEDHDANATRFLLMAKSGVPAPTGHDKTSIVCFQSEDVPGSLQGMLGQFSARGINLVKLESRTTKQGLGSYCFVIDFEGHIADELVSDALLSLRANSADVKFLGSYPTASEDAHSIREDSAKRWTTAHEWLDSFRAQIK